jgi:hypothetical protein
MDVVEDPLVGQAQTFDRLVDAQVRLGISRRSD